MVSRIVDNFPPLAPEPVRAWWAIGISMTWRPARFAIIASWASTNADELVRETDFMTDVFISRTELASFSVRPNSNRSRAL